MRYNVVRLFQQDGLLGNIPDSVFQLRVVASTTANVEASGAELINWSIISIVKPSRADQGRITTSDRVLRSN